MPRESRISPRKSAMLPSKVSDMDPARQPAALVEVFLASLGESVRTGAGGTEALGPRLAAAIEEARAAWPDLDVRDEAYVQHLARHATDDPIAWLERVRADDLFLAFGCASGDAVALAAFDRIHGTEMRSLADRLVPSAIAQEVVQTLHQQLLVASDEREPGIAKYAGQGRLRGWLRVTTVREALRARKKKGLEVPAEENALEAVGTAGADPELRYMKELYKAEFREAFADALAALTARERTLLRYTVIDGLSVDRVGAIYRVHRATAARWVAKARERLVAETRQALMRRLAVGAPEQESILRLIRSDLDLSIRSFLREEAS